MKYFTQSVSPRERQALFVASVVGGTASLLLHLAAWTGHSFSFAVAMLLHVQIMVIAFRFMSPAAKDGGKMIDISGTAFAHFQNRFPTHFRIAGIGAGVYVMILMIATILRGTDAVYLVFSGAWAIGFAMFVLVLHRPSGSEDAEVDNAV